jgi:hypothetical protein
LALRTSAGVDDINHFHSLLVTHREAIIEDLVDQWLAMYDDERLQLTDAGMDVYNSIVTELLGHI